jgi:tetratricopeptide (TPR) repeat protein
MPKVAVTWTRHGEDPTPWVTGFAEDLRHHGIETTLDAWDLAPGASLDEFHDHVVRDHDFLLLICTPAYKARFDDLRGGVGEEARRMAARPEARLIPILRGPPETSLPELVRGHYALDVDDAEALQRLIDYLHGRPSGSPLGVPWSVLPDVFVDVDADLAWTFSSPGGRVSHAPPRLQEEAGRLRELVCVGLPCDARGHLSAEAAAQAAHGRALAAEVGDRLAALLPEAAMTLLARRLGATGAAVRQPGALRLRVRGAAREDVLALPWEVLRVGGQHLLEGGRMQVIREVDGPGEPAVALWPLRLVAHIAQPEGVPGLDLERAAWRMARALDHLVHPADGLAAVRFTELGSLEDLRRVTAEHRPSLVMLSGHGEPGALLLEDDEGGPALVPILPGDKPCVVDALRHAEGLPAAVWLSCCYGAGKRRQKLGWHREAREPGRAAAVGSTERVAGADGAPHAVDPADPPATALRDLALDGRDASTAAALHAAGVPHVMGYFGPVPDPLAVAVDEAMVRALAERGQVLDAVSAARRAACSPVDLGHEEHQIWPLGWSLVVVYHRGPDLQFEAVGARPRPVSEAHGAPLSLQGLPVLEHGFIGRRRLLARLRRHAQDRALALHGEGGLGKTSTLIKLAELLGGPDWQRRTWVLAAQTEEGELRARGERAEGGLVRHDPWVWVMGQVDALLQRPPDGAARDALRSRLTVLHEVTSDRLRGERLAALLREAAGPHGLIVVDNAESLMTDPAEGPVRWRDAATGAFFTALLQRPGTLLSSRYAPDNPGDAWLAIDTCAAGELLRMMAFHPRLRLLRTQARHALAERLEGHPRSVVFVDALLDRRGFGTDPEKNERLLAEALVGLPARIEADLLVERLVAGLDEEGLQQLAESVELGLPVPWAVVEKMGPRSDRLRDLGLLVRWREETEAWRVQPFVVEALRRGGWLGGRSWTAGVRREVGRYWKENARSLAGILEAIGHLRAAGEFAEAMEVVGGLSRVLTHMGLPKQRLEQMQDLGSQDWPQAQQMMMAVHLSNALDGMGEYGRAEQVLRVVLAGEGAERGTDAERGLVLHSLANSLWRQGWYAEAEQVFRESITIQEQAYGTRQHAEVAVSVHGLATVLKSQGRYAEAEQVFRESITILERAYGTRQHASVAASVHGLATVLECQGRYAEAEEAFRESITILERAYGTRQHASVAASVHGLATVLSSQIRYTEAEEAFRESITILERAYGTRQHASVAASVHGLANVLERRGRYAEAEQAFRGSITIVERAYGTRQHASVAASVVGLATVLFRQGRYAEAERACREAIGVYVAVHGRPDHPATAMTSANLAIILLRQKRPAAALPELQLAWDTAVRHGVVHEAVQFGPRLVRLLTTFGREDQARQIAGQVVALLQQLPADHPVRRQVEQQLGQDVDPYSDLQEVLQALQAALAAGDVTRLRPLAQRTHDLAHQLGQEPLAAQLATLLGQLP